MRGGEIVNPLFVGIDVSSKNNVAYLMKPDGSKHSSFSVQNNLGGAKLLSERIVSALCSMQLSNVVIGLEATSIYGDSLVYALREDGSLGRFQRKIHVLNPKQVRKFKEAYPDLPKNDFVDAFVIADHLRFGRIAKEVYMDDYRYQALKTLTRARFDVIQNLTREKQRFANYLFLKCSGIAQDKDIQNTSATTIALMERFETVDERQICRPRCCRQSGTGCGQRLLSSAQDSERHREPGHGRLYCLHAGTEGAGQGSRQSH